MPTKQAIAHAATSLSWLDGIRVVRAVVIETETAGRHGRCQAGSPDCENRAFATRDAAGRNTVRRMPTIRIPPTLRSDAAGRRDVEVRGRNVAEAFDALIQSFPGLAPRLLEDGDVPAFLNVFVDGADIRTLDGLQTALQPQSAILLLPALAGGAG